MANFPTSFDTFTTLLDNVDDALAAHQNDRGSAITAIETKIGVNNSAVVTTLDYKIRNLPTQDSDRDVGDIVVRAKQFYADIATGTAPLTVDSTTKVTNLNADQVDGLEAAAFVLLSGVQSIDLVKTFTSIPVLPASDPTTDNQAVRKAYVDSNGFRAKVINIDRDLTAGSGSVAYTGVGFRPKAVFAMLCKSNSQGACWGITNVTRSFVIYGGGGGSFGRGSEFLLVFLGGADQQAGSIASFDADGFTVNWIKSGSPTGTANGEALCIG